NRALLGGVGGGPANVSGKGVGGAAGAGSATNRSAFLAGNPGSNGALTIGGAGGGNAQLLECVGCKATDASGGGGAGGGPRGRRRRVGRRRWRERRHRRLWLGGVQVRSGCRARRWRWWRWRRWLLDPGRRQQPVVRRRGGFAATQRLRRHPLGRVPRFQFPL